MTAHTFHVRQPHRRIFSHRLLMLLAGGLLLVGLSACGGSEAAEPTPTRTATAAPTRTPVSLYVPPPTATPTPTPVPPSPTPSVTPSATPIPPTVVPPIPFKTSALTRGARAVSYIADECEYLARRWDATGSAPGTIIVPIMYHGVGARANRGDGDTWTPTSYFRRTLAEAKKLGFETITAAQAADFLERNAAIPPRSLLLIVDDRRAGTVEDSFLPVLERNDWTVTLGWIIANSDRKRGLWERMERLYESGRLDVQSHGLRHLYISSRTRESLIREELFDAIPILESHFGKRPIAFIWPGGMFTSKAVDIAEEAGFRIAFTASPWGPLMYNWIPQGKAERKIDRPLMLLPRYWAYPGMITNLREAAKIGDAARQQALDRFMQEAAYFERQCGGVLASPDGDL